MDYMKYINILVLIMVLIVPINSGAVVTLTAKAGGWETSNMTLCSDGTYWTACPASLTGIIFEDNFDAQPDWVAAKSMDCEGRTSAPCAYTLPDNWDYVRNVESWHPTEGEPTKKAGQYISSDQFEGASGKSWIRYHESDKDASTDSNTWGNDGMMLKQLDQDYQEIYATFDIKFDSGWQWASGHTGIFKLFRASHFDNATEGSPWAYFTSGDHGPLALFDLKESPTWGFRGTYALRCDPQEDVYYCAGGDEDDSLLPGTTVDTPFNTTLGDGGWHTMTYRLKMNSALTIADGVFQVWVDGQLLMDRQDIPWRSTNSSLSNGWNMIGLGGNTTNWYSLPVNKAEQWYAIDNFKVATQPF